MLCSVRNPDCMTSIIIPRHCSCMCIYCPIFMCLLKRLYSAHVYTCGKNGSRDFLPPRCIQICGNTGGGLAQSTSWVGSTSRRFSGKKVTMLCGVNVGGSVHTHTWKILLNITCACRSCYQFPNWHSRLCAVSAAKKPMCSFSLLEGPNKWASRSKDLLKVQMMGYPMNLWQSANDTLKRTSGLCRLPQVGHWI